MGLISIPVTIGKDVHKVDLDTGNSRFGLFMPADHIGTLPTRGSVRYIGVARSVSYEIHLHAIDVTAPVRVGFTVLPVTAVAYPSLGADREPGLARAQNFHSNHRHEQPSREDRAERTGTHGQVAQVEVFAVRRNWTATRKPKGSCPPKFSVDLTSYQYFAVRLQAVRSF